MTSVAKSRIMWLWDRPGTGAPNSDSNSDPCLEVNVVFTTSCSTPVALKAADELARNLNARIFFLVPQPVPFHFPLTNPPVSAAFAAERFGAMAKACREAVEVRVDVYFCRDRDEVLLQVLKPQSLVVLGGRKRWWPTAEQNLARTLRAHGHRVIFVDHK